MVGIRLHARAAPPAVSISAATSLTLLAGGPPPVPAPPQGGFLVMASGQRLVGDAAPLASLAPDTPRPMASIAKVMTALVTLRALPLGVSEEGPVATFDAVDVADLARIAAANGSRLPVAVGERLSERQLLIGLLLPSADNFAEKLARWVSPTRDDFIVRLNSAAAQLGMTATHFVDPSGLDAATVSTPRDLIRLAGAALVDPVVSAIVDTATATLSDGTAVANTDYWVGAVDGWLGIKTGTAAADDHELLFAARRRVAGASEPQDSVTVTGVVLGQPTKQAAMDAARGAVDAALAGYAVVDTGALRPAASGSITTAWGPRSRLVVGAPRATERLVVRLGSSVAVTPQQNGALPPLQAGGEVGELDAALAGHPLAPWPVVSVVAVPGPSLGDRLLGRIG